MLVGVFGLEKEDCKGAMKRLRATSLGRRREREGGEVKGERPSGSPSHGNSIGDDCSTKQHCTHPCNHGNTHSRIRREEHLLNQLHKDY